MTDIYDKATEVELRDTALAIASARNQQNGPAYTGRCLYCKEPTPKGHRWCDEYCRDDYETRERMDKISGRA